MSADTLDRLSLPSPPSEEHLPEIKDNHESDGTFEFHDTKGRLVFTVSPVGMDTMSPDKIEEWQIVLPLTAFGNEVGDIAISHQQANSGKESKYFSAMKLQDGDAIILKDKKQNKRLVVSVSINPETMKIKLTPTEQE